MKTLLIISHPNYQESMGQQFLKESILGFEDVTIHHLDSCYGTSAIDIATEVSLLKEHDRIVFQFPLYWYSSPSLLKEWQDQVLSSLSSGALKGKAFGLVISVGANQKDYRPGGKLGLTMEHILAPYQALANYFEMIYLPHFAINQFVYQTDAEKVSLVTDYQYYLTGPANQSLAERTQWLISHLKRSQHKDQAKLQLLVGALEENAETLADLNDTLSEMTAEGGY
ncbi:NAD(P)H-dependent oxidoreductase [Vagococcus coleopterorum]|uniref:NAD(P)H-dependent oxidoreductase n=1 Tax=Vagococcus coleopterorum TaxID=2714946 RepID=A0A6G8AMW2_9ENTE|nr:NAD(P)H-dependent oxidoreductase [Vagococcus coleopterorum]QIL46265.1 NAD(P)H-dependent oxidoreductase [Vagococcus coleopterorum]